MITINSHNETYIKISCSEDHIYRELQDYFTITIPGSNFRKWGRLKYWNTGQIRLFDLRTHQLYKGLLKHVEEFAKQSNYLLNYTDNNLNYSNDVSLFEVEQFAKSLKLPHVPHKHQIDAVTHALRNKRILLLSPTACHPKGQKILTYNGNLINVENIKIGDQLMGIDNKPRIVQKLYNGVDDIYKITGSRCDPFYVNKEHILYLRKTGTNETIKISVKDYLNKSNWFKHMHYLISNNAILEFPKSQPYVGLLTPYYIGAYLGDGHVHNCSITTMDPEIANEVYYIASKTKNAKIRISCNGSKASSYTISGFNGLHNPNPIIEEFHKIGLHFGANKKYIRTTCATKYIPEILKTGTIKDRFELLAGLIDTDGTANGAFNTKNKKNTYYTYSSKSEQLVKDVAFVAGSLGFVTIIGFSLKGHKKAKYYHCSIMGDVTSIPLRLSRKKITNQPTDKKNKHNHKILNIEYIGNQEYFGFELDKDHLYLTDNFIINHNSGKSLVAYLLVRALGNITKRKILLIVPTINLVSQMYTDFMDYSQNNHWDCEKNIHLIFEGQPKETEKQIIISTWQSLQTCPKSLLEGCGAVIGDEAHGYTANVLKGIVALCTNASYRIGMTGTIQDTKSHQLTLEGLFGPIYQPTTTMQLINEGKLSRFIIKVIVLKHEQPWMVETYEEELEYLFQHKQRNRFIVNLAMSLEKNTLVLFSRIEKHGQLLKDLFDEINKEGKKKIYYIHGKVDKDIREDVRKIAEQENNAIIIGSVGTWSTGANLKNLHNIIFAAPSKSRIRVLQSIGRELRIHPTKHLATLFDIGDDLCYNNKKNWTLQHLADRLKIYNQEKFFWKQYKVGIK